VPDRVEPVLGERRRLLLAERSSDAEERIGV
jgi:hypothetical protein